MRVVLRNNAIFVQGSSNTLEEPWMEEFFEHHIYNTLFLDNGVLVLNNEHSSEKKEEFLETLSDEFTRINDLSSPFYRRSLKRCKTAAVRIELPYREEEKVEIELYAFSSSRVRFTLDSPNGWIMRYLKQQLSGLVINATSTQIDIDVGTAAAKARLEKTLNRREVLHYAIHYRYDDEFMSRLYSQYKGWGFSSESIDKMIRYHAIFELPVGAKPTDLKKQYRKLARRYHPDRVQTQSPEVINKYTQKFQLLQEAYDALRAAS
ncbi:MAG: J domain-containing protein [Sulfuricurvum sp.]|nr:J domain-containing protein [Sulfuricurvum sp.]